MEAKILNAGVVSRVAFDQLEGYNIFDDLTDQSQVVWSAIRKYYDMDHDCHKVDTELLKEAIARESPKHADMFATVIDGFDTVSVPNLLHEVIEQKRESNTLKLIQALSSDKDDTVEELLESRGRLIAGEVGADDNSDVVIAPDLAANSSPART